MARPHPKVPYFDERDFEIWGKDGSGTNAKTVRGGPLEETPTRDKEKHEKWKHTDPYVV